MAATALEPRMVGGAKNWSMPVLSTAMSASLDFDRDRRHTRNTTTPASRINKTLAATAMPMIAVSGSGPAGASASEGAGEIDSSAALVGGEDAVLDAAVADSPLTVSTAPDAPDVVTDATPVDAAEVLVVEVLDEGDGIDRAVDVALVGGLGAGAGAAVAAATQNELVHVLPAAHDEAEHGQPSELHCGTQNCPLSHVPPVQLAPLPHGHSSVWALLPPILYVYVVAEFDPEKNAMYIGAEVTLTLNVCISAVTATLYVSTSPYEPSLLGSVMLAKLSLFRSTASMGHADSRVPVLLVQWRCVCTGMMPVASRRTIVAEKGKRPLVNEPHGALCNSAYGVLGAGSAVKRTL
jgi:hypothetical protein